MSDRTPDLPQRLLLTAHIEQHTGSILTAQLLRDAAHALAEREAAHQHAKDFINLLTRGKAPCGHWSAYSETSDGGKHISCLRCELDAEQAAHQATKAERDALKPLALVVISRCKRCGEEWPHWGVLSSFPVCLSCATAAEAERDRLAALLVDEIEDCRTACEERDRLAEAQQWRPIATAPKDGTRILVTGTANGNRTEIVFWWDGNFQNPAGWRTGSGLVYPDRWLSLLAAPRADREDQP